VTSGNPVRIGGDPVFLPGMPRHLHAVAAGRERPSPELLAEADALEAQAERDAVEDMRARQQAFRDRAWAETRPAKFRRATLDGLEGHQDPRGVVRGWLGSPSATLVLHGPPRRGKSHTAFAVGQAARQDGMWVAGYTAKTLLDFLRPSQMDPARPERTRMMVTDSDLLILDELGAEKIDTEFAVAELTDVIDARIRDGRRLVVTTNLDDVAMVGRYGDRIVYRLIELATIVKVTGPVMKPLPLF
jgi:DNA replication protein DnaC